MGKIFAKSRPNHYRSQCARNPCGSCRNRSSARLFSRRAARHTPNAGRVRGREFCRRSPRRRARRSCRRGSTVYLRPQDPLRLARSSAGPPARQQERIADGARKARDPTEHQRLRERRSLPGHQAQDQRRNPQRRRPRLPRRLSRPPEDLRQERHRILGLPRRTPQSPRLPTYPSPRRNRQRARPPAAMIASAFAPATIPRDTNSAP